MVDHRLRVATSSPIGTLAFILWGMIVWGLQFSASYAGHTLLCRIGAPAGTSALMVAALAILAVAAIAPVAFFPRAMARLAGIVMTDADRAHILTIGRVIAILSIIAAIWTATGIFLIGQCELGR
jgi:hypothetical protein